MGDKVELTAVATAYAQTVGPEAAAAARSAVGMTSIKSLLGHCKAAAGMAGLLKVGLAICAFVSSLQLVDEVSTATKLAHVFAEAWSRGMRL